MLPFYLLLIIPAGLYFFTYHTKQKAYAGEYALKCFFIILFLLVALRKETVGNDTMIYRYYFYRISDMNFFDMFSLNMEFGFILYSKIISLFTQNFQVFLTITSAITTYSIYNVYKKHLKDSAITIVLFINISAFVMLFSGIRQMIAIALGMVAFSFVQKRKPVPFILIVFIAMTFHISAFMLLLMYPLYYLKMRKHYIYIILPLLLVVFLFNSQIFRLVVSILPSKYSSAATSSTGAYMFIILLVIMVIYSFVIPKQESLERNTIGMRNFLILSLIVQLFAPVYATAMRMNYYYLIFLPLLIPGIMEAKRESMKDIVKVSKIVMIVFFTVYFFYNARSATGNLHVFPYKFFWENVI